MKKNGRLELLSDKVRMGIPINFSEAFEVLEYQECLRAEREAKLRKTIIGRLIRWIRICQAVARECLVRCRRIKY